MTIKRKVNKKALLASTSLEQYRAAGGDDEMSSENQHIRDQLVRREVAQCVSMLVHHFATNEAALTGSDYSYDDILELCQQDDWESSVREHADFVSAEEEYGETYIKLKGRADDDQLTDWREAAEALRIDDPQRHEAYEHWIVTGWFAKQLKSHGEMTGELLGLTIWGRCTTGQSISMDSVIGAIAAEMQILVGQANDWSKQK